MLRPKRSFRRPLAAGALALLLTPALAAEIRNAAREDTRRRTAIRWQLEEWRAAGQRMRDRGLAVEAWWVPDALAWKVARQYLAARDGGAPHDAALEKVSGSLPRWRRHAGRALVVVKLENEEPRPRRGVERVYTLRESLAREAIEVRSRESRLPAALGTKPPGLRLAELRVEKFWRTQDGATRLPRSPDDPDLRDPASLGRRAMRSDPFRAALLEEDPATVEVLLPGRAADPDRVDELAVEVADFERYDGPFDGKTLDLNHGGPWEPIRPIRLRLAGPPGRGAVRPELRNLLEAVRAHAAGEGEAPPADGGERDLPDPDEPAEGEGGGILRRDPGADGAPES